MIVVSYNTREATLACLQSVIDGQAGQLELLVVDNNSTDGTAGALEDRLPQVRVLAQTENLGFARACNAGARVARGRNLLFLNSDCLVEPTCLATLAEFLDRNPNAAVAVPRLTDTDGRVQTNVVPLPTVRSIASAYLLGRAVDRYRSARLTRATPVEACSGAALLIRREDFWAVGGFYEAYFMYVEDVELCRRLRALGKQIFYVPDAVAQHEEGGSSRANARSLEAMLTRNLEDYLKRTMPPPRATAAVLAMRLGTAITPARNSLLAAARRSSARHGRVGAGRAEDPEMP